jgi:hypothetical protein
VARRVLIPLRPVYWRATVTIDETLDQLEDNLRKLGIEYEVYFSGGKKRPPADLAWRVDNYFRVLNDNTTLSYAQRFRLTQLQQRHGMLSSVWRRKAEIKERGWRRQADRLLAVAGAGENTGPTPQKLEQTIDLGHGGKVDEANIERLYAVFLRARERVTDAPPAGSLDRFREFINQKADKIRSEQGSKNVEATVAVESGRLKLVLKPSKKM